MIQLANKRTEWEVRQMWKTCFNDSDEFTDLYFSEKYTNENTLIYFEGDKAVASLQMQPYRFNFCGTEIPVAYISGACTLPEYRHRGLMGKLLLEAFNLMREREIPLSILIPAEAWLYDYYAQYGYETVFEAEKKEIPLKEIIAKSNGDMDAAYSVFNELFRNKDFCIQKTKADFITIVKDAELDGFPTKTNLSGMARIIDAQALLKIFGMKYPEKLVSFALEDKIISQNSAYYELQSGKLNILKINPEEKTFHFNPNGLCRLLFGFRLEELPKNEAENFISHQPIMNLMLE